MRFGILGPIELHIDGSRVPLGGLKQRALLAFLLLHANEVASRDRLIDALWGESPPPSASDALDTYVYRLRKLIGYGRLARHGGGYLLSVEAGELDAGRFELLVSSAGEAAGAGDSRGAARMLTDALALWRGPALADVLYLPFADDPARHLEEQRLGALESRIEAKLDCGGGAALVPELEHLVADHPLRERLVAALMLALYRAGRQADALAVFQAARGRLVEELGLEPGPEMRRLQQRILQHDPALAVPDLAVRSRRQAARTTRLAAVAALFLGVVLAAGLLASSGTAHSAQAKLVDVNGLVAVDTAAGRVVTATPLSETPGAVGSGAGSVWTAEPSGMVTRVDPSSGAAVDQILVDGDPGSVAAGDGAIWAASTVGATVTRIDPVTEGVTQTISLPGPAWARSGSGWAGCGSLPQSLTSCSARSIPRAEHWSGRCRWMRSPARSRRAGAVWVAGYDNAAVEKIDPATARVTGRVHVGDGPAALVFAAGSLWVANSLDSPFPGSIRRR